MRLAELCEPLFQYACLLSRSGRRGGTHGLDQVRSEAIALFDDLGAKAAGDPKLSALYARVDLALRIFLDETIKQSGLKFAAEWRDLAAEHGELQGDERFFDLLDDTLRDTTTEAAETLGVFYTCLGLGFRGWYAGQPEHLRKRQRELAARMRLPVETAQNARIVPEAYEHVDTSNLIETPKASLVGIALALTGLIVVLVTVNFLLYRAGSFDLDQAIGSILTQSRSNAPPVIVPATVSAAATTQPH